MAERIKREATKRAECGNCDYFTDAFNSGLCTNPLSRNCGGSVGRSEQCGRWSERKYVKPDVHIKIDAYEGLKVKYLVFKSDTGEQIENCFVLRPDKDEAAVEALRAYAEATDNKILSEDIYNWVGKGVAAQSWIPANEPPKEYRDEYGELIPFLVCLDGTEYPFRAMYDGKVWGDGWGEIPVTYWMPLPEPPKGELQCE